MNIQEQLEKMEGDFYDKFGILQAVKNDISGNAYDRVSDFLHTSFLKLLKTAYEEEREMLKSKKHYDINPFEIDSYYLGHDSALQDTITHLNTKIAEVDRLLDNK